MILLTATSQSLQLQTSVAGNVDVAVSFVDFTASATTPGSNQVNITTTAQVEVLAAPASGAQRQVKQIIIANRASAANTVRLWKDVASVDYAASPSVTLSAGETLAYDDGAGWRAYTASGAVKQQDARTQGIDGQPAFIQKIGTAPKAAGILYCWAKDNGSPGAWSPGTPGMSGRATDGTASSDYGCIPIKNPGSGANYLAQINLTASVACNVLLGDVLWVNTGIAVTTTAAQTVNSVTFPARDNNGASDGENVQIGILVATATTNGAAITNCTLSYTNDLGVSGRTASMASFPATASAGTFVLFQLQAGDRGVRSVQSVTLGTSFGGGAVSLVAVRFIAGQPILVANVGGVPDRTLGDPGVRLYNGACLLPFQLPTTTTATVLVGTLAIVEK